MSPRTSIRLLLLLACLGAVTARVTAQDAVPEKLRPAYAKLQASSAGDWLARVEQSSGLIRELWGARASAPGRDSRETAEAFLKDHAELFGMKADGSDRRELGRLLSAVGERFVYQQMAAGLPVLGRKSLVSVDSRLRVQAVANRFGPVQKVAGLDAPVSREHAIALALAASGTGTRLRAPAQAELAVLADGDSGEAAWRVVLACRAPLADWEVVVSAKDGRVLRKRSLLVAATGSGKVFDPNPVVALGDRTLRDGGDADGPQFAAAYRVVALPRLDGSGLLRGQWADVHSQTNEVKGVPGPFTRALEPTLNFLYPRSDKRFEETNIYYHLDAIQTYIQQTIGVSNANARVTTANAHEDDVFNSFYSPATRSIYYEDGAGGVDLAEDSDVVVHEYGHAVQDNQVPGWGSVEEGGAMGEGFADFLACVYSSTKTVNAGGPDPDPACVGEWAFSGRGNCLRRTDGTKHYPQDLDSEVHDDGEIWSACLWQIRGLYGNTIALRLVLESHFLLDDFADFFAGANAILTADDNLYGGTHKSAIRDIFIARGILDPATFPAVTQLVPDSLDTDKGGQLGIVGSHFAGATAVALAGPVGRVLTPSSVTDARVDVTIPAGLLAGQYTVKVSTPAGLNTKSPPLSMQFPDDHTNSCTGLGAADRVVVGGNGSSGTIDSSGDRDLFSVDIPAAGTYRFGVIGFSLNDPYLTLLDQDCSKILAQNDDDGPGLDPLIVHVFARPGTYFLRARDFSTRTGTYRVAAGGAPAALQIESITPSWPKLSVGQTIAVSVVVKNTGMTAASLSAESLTIAGAAVSAAPLAVSVSLPGGGVTTSFQFTVSGLSLGRATLTSAVFTAASVVDLTAVPVAANRATPASVDVVKPEPTLVLETLTATRNAIAVGEVLQATVTMRNEGTIRANVTTPRLVTTRATLTPSTPSLSTSIDPMGGRRQFTFDVTGASVGLGTITSATLAATDAQSGKPAPITTNRAAAANVIVGTPTPLLRIVSIDTSRSQIDVGQPLAVTVKFKNEGSGPADVSSTRLVFSGSSLAAAASTTGFSIAGFGATASVTFGGLGVSAGSCTISSATVTATNPSLGGGPVGIGANSAAARIVTVQVPAAVSVTSVTATAQTVSRRQTGVRVTVRIANTGEASMGAPAVELTSVLRVGANSAGYTVTRLSAQPAVLAAGQTAYVTYNVDVLDTAPLGATNVAAEVRAKDGNTQEALSAGGSVLTSWTVKAAAKLAVGPIAAARSTVIRGDTGVLVQVPVSNTAPVADGAVAVSIAAGLAFNGSTAGYRVTPMTAGVTLLAPGNSVTYFFSVDVLDTAPRGATRIAADVSALDSISAQPVALDNSTEASWTAFAPGSLRVTSLVPSAQTVSVGQAGAAVRAGVTNPGDVAVDLTAGLRFAGSTAGYSVTTAAGNVRTLSGLASAVLTFGVDVLGSATPGQAAISLDARASTGGAPAPVDSTASGSWTVQTSPTLEVRLLPASRSRLVPGVRGTVVQASIRNTGQPSTGAAALVTATLGFAPAAVGYSVVAAAGNARTIGAGQTRVLTFVVDAGQPALGLTTVTAQVAGTDANTSLPVGSLSGSPATTWVMLRPAAIVAGFVAPTAAVVTRGQRGLDVRLRLANGGETAAERLAVSLRFNNSSDGFAVRPAAGNAGRLSVAETRELTFAVDALSAAPLGAVTVTAVVGASESIGGAAAQVSGPDAGPRWTVRAASALAVLSVRPGKAAVARGETRVPVEVVVTNGGQAPVAGLTPSLTFGGLTAGFGVLAAPGNASAAGAGETVTLTMAVDVLPEAPTGSTAIAATVTGVEDGTGARVSASGQAASGWSVLVPGSARLDALAISRTVATAGQRGLAVTLAVTNPGQTALSGLAAFLRFNGSSEGFGVTPQRAQAGALAAGASALVTFAVDVLAAAPIGTTTIAAVVTASEAATGGAAAVLGEPAAHLTVQAPPRLALRAIETSQPALAPGDSCDLTVTLDNLGGASARVASVWPVVDAPAVLTVTGGAAPVDLAGGSTRALRFAVRALSTGAARISTALVTATDANTRLTIGLAENLALPGALVSVGPLPLATLAVGARAYIVDGVPVRLVLDASGSFDPGGGALVYRWGQTTGPSVELSSASTAMQAPVAAASGLYGFRVTVATGIGLTSSAEAVVTVGTNGSPEVSVATPGRVLAGERVRLSASATDPESDSLAYRWEQISGPADLDPAALSTQGLVLTVVPALAGDYRLRLTVSDAHGGRASAVTTLQAGEPTVVTVLLGVGPNFLSLPLAPLTSDGHLYDASDLSRDAGDAVVCRSIGGTSGRMTFATYLPGVGRPFLLEPGAGYVVLSQRAGAVTWRGRAWPANTTSLILRPDLTLAGYPRGVPSGETAETLEGRAAVRFVVRTRAVAGRSRLELHLPGFTEPFGLAAGEAYLLPVDSKRTFLLPDAGGP